MTKDSRLSKASLDRQTQLRRQPKQKRGKQRVEKILQAAAEVFLEVGYANATTHMIAERAETAIGSLYQFFPDKKAIFYAMELEHTQRVEAFWAAMDIPSMIQLPLDDMIGLLIDKTNQVFENPLSRVVFIEFFRSREIFQAIDDRMTQGAIQFLDHIMEQRNPTVQTEQRQLLAEVCIHSGNALLLAAFRHPDPAHSQKIIDQAKALLTRYTAPFDTVNANSNVMKVMKCPHCHSQELSKNGFRRGKQCFLCKDCRKQFVLPTQR